MHAEAPPPPSSPWHERSLSALLSEAFGGLPPATQAALRAELRWQTLTAGTPLMREGEPGDAMYWLISGRLLAYVDAGDDRPPRRVREMGCGDVVGEISLFTGEPRSASVVAVRDSLLVRLDAERGQALLAEHPALLTQLSRRLVQRLRSERDARPWAAPRTVLLEGDADLATFAGALERALSAFGPVRRVTHAEAEQASQQLPMWEADNRFVLLQAEPGDEEWNAWCRRQADEWLLLVDGDAQPSATVAQAWRQAPSASAAARWLLLQHAPDLRCPRGTADWLQALPVQEHLHLRRGSAADLQRLARLIARQAVGLVLAGGGARGFAHLGVLRALQEAGVPIDAVGGTSMGAVMASLVASQRSQPDLMPLVRSAFRRNPTGDYNWLPLISLIRGRRLRQALRDAVIGLCGHAARIEDLWLGCYAVATNYGRASEVVLRRGDLQTVVAASAAIPGALPPVVVDGELHCDGGSFNNLPLDVMRAQRGIGRVIGVDLLSHQARKLDFDTVPGPWTLLRDRLRPRRARRYKLPSLVAYLLNNTILYSVARKARDAALADLLLQPPLHRVGLLDWTRLDSCVQQGYEHACQVLAEPGVRARLAPLSDLQPGSS